MANTKPIKIDRFDGGLNTSEPTIIDDNQLAQADNMYYNKNKILTTRKGIETFGNEISGVDYIHSIYFSEFSDGTRVLLCGAGTKVYRYNEGTTNWDEIKSGLTNNLRLSFATFKDIIYWTNGTDNVMSYDGTTVTEHPGVQKGKYLIIANDVGYMGGVDVTGDRSVVFYTNPNPTDLKSAFPNNEPIDEDNGQIITGLTSLGAVVFIGKENSIYKLDTISSPVIIEKVDYSGGVASHRSWQNVENDILHLADEGIFSLAQRRGTIGSYRAISLTDNIEKFIRRIKTKPDAAAIYYPKERNYYLSYDDKGAGRNRAILVWSVLTRSWTRYDGINANDFTIYVDSNGEQHLLYAGAFGGQAYEMEVGFTDNELSIGNTAQTKTFDFGSPEILKLFEYIDIIGFISRQATIDAVIDIDGTETTCTIVGSEWAIGAAADFLTLGEEPVGEEPLTGGAVAEDGIQMFPFIVRIPLMTAGRNIFVRLDSNSLNSAWQLTKANAYAVGMPVDVMYTSYIC